MRQEIEIEFKNMLTAEEFHRLCETFSVTSFTTQVNHYFETPSFSLRATGSALRIRQKENRYTMTLKQPAKIGLLETHQTLSQQEARAMLEGGRIVEGAVYEQLLALHIPAVELTYYGSLSTDRAELTYKNGILVLDHSFYFAHDDYELEYEVREEEEGKRNFLSLLKEQHIPIRPTKNKVQRFFLAKQDEAQ